MIYPMRFLIFNLFEELVVEKCFMSIKFSQGQPLVLSEIARIVM